MSTRWDNINYNGSSPSDPTPSVDVILYTSNLAYTADTSVQTQDLTCLTDCFDVIPPLYRCNASCEKCDYGTSPNLCGLQPTIQTTQGQSTKTSDDEGCSPGAWPACRYTCKKTITQLCGTFDPDTTAKIGARGIGKCFSDTCEKGKYWDMSDITNYKVGWMRCLYKYDYLLNGGFAYSNTGNNNNILSSWLTDLCIEKKDGFNIPPLMAIYIRDSNVIFNTILEFYNQIYYDGYYTNNKSTNPFSIIDFCDTNKRLDYTNQFINISLYSVSTIFPGKIPPQQLINTLTSALTYPIPVYNKDENKYYMNLTLSYFEAVKWQNMSPQSVQDNFIKNKLVNFLQDASGSMADIGKNIALKIKLPSFQNSQILTYSIIQFLDDNQQNNYTFLTFKPRDPVPSNLNYITCSVTFQMEITEWSPMLLVYFEAFSNNTPYDVSTCQKIANDIGTIPSKCFVCQNTDIIDCKQTIIDFCPISYTPPQSVKIDTENILISENNDKCKCYTSRLPPVNQSVVNNQTAMCFDISCTPSYLDTFGLTNEVCSANCDTMYGWIHAKDPGGQSHYLKDLNKTRYQNICGDKTDPYTSNKINIQVLVLGLVMTLLGSLLIFSISKYNNISLLKSIFIIIVFAGIFIFITIFLSKDLAGKTMCDDGKKMICLSSITHKKIPVQFCNYILNCECLLDQDCGSSNCKCFSSTCLPTVGVRNSQVVYENVPNVILVIVSSIVSIVLPITFWYFYEDYHLKIPKNFFIPITILISLLPFIISVYGSFKKYPKTIFTEPCS